MGRGRVGGLKLARARKREGERARLGRGGLPTGLEITSETTTGLVISWGRWGEQAIPLSAPKFNPVADLPSHCPHHRPGPAAMPAPAPASDPQHPPPSTPTTPLIRASHLNRSYSSTSTYSSYFASMVAPTTEPNGHHIPLPSSSTHPHSHPHPHAHATASAHRAGEARRHGGLRRRLGRGASWLSTSHELENKGSVARDHLALERTYLAWLRTSLSLASIGVGEWRNRLGGGRGRCETGRSNVGGELMIRCFDCSYYSTVPPSGDYDQLWLFFQFERQLRLPRRHAPPPRPLRPRRPDPPQPRLHIRSIPHRARRPPRPVRRQDSSTRAARLSRWHGLPFRPPQPARDRRVVRPREVPAPRQAGWRNLHRGRAGVLDAG